MRNFLKWIGILTVANFSGLLVVPFMYLATHMDGFWSGFGVILLTNVFATWLYMFVGGLIGGILKMSETQHLWYMLLTVVSVIIHFVNAADISVSLTIKTAIIAVYPLYVFLIAPEVIKNH